MACSAGIGLAAAISHLRALPPNRRHPAIPLPPALQGRHHIRIHVPQVDDRGQPLVRQRGQCHQCARHASCPLGVPVAALQIQEATVTTSPTPQTPPCRSDRDSAGPTLLDMRASGGHAAVANPPCMAFPSAPTSIGSPRGVPVPCSEATATSVIAAVAMLSAVRIRAVCAGPFGAVRPLLRPSWLTAVPQISPMAPSWARWSAAARTPVATASPRPGTDTTCFA